MDWGEDDDDNNDEDDNIIDHRKPAAKRGKEVWDGDDDNEDFANMSELDISDDDSLTPISGGRKRNSGGPPVPMKGSVPDHVYEEAMKRCKKFNDRERYKKAKATGSIATAVNVVFTGHSDENLRPMSVVKDYRLKVNHTWP